MTKDEALKLAHEALEANYQLINGTDTEGGLVCCIDGYYSDCFDEDPINEQTEKAINAIKETLAQEQEPVAWRKREVGGGWQYYGWKETGMTYESVKRINKNGFECEAIPATPPQRTWVGLTAGEILDALISVDEKTVRLPSMLGQFACAIESKLKEKNT